jgi:hypothetical protein
MKRLLMAAALFTAGILAGCSNPRDELAEKCAKCTGNTKTSCDQAVATYRSVPLTGNAACQQVLDANVYGSCQ